MKSLRITSFCLVPIMTIFGQNNKSNADSPVLDTISVQGVPVQEFEFSRSTALSGSQIESQKISSIADLSGLSPSLYINSNGIQSYGNVISLRGISNTQLFGDPAVGLYIDGVSSGSTATYSSALFEIEDIEVLKGYHGHRFGKNTPAGIVNIKTRRAGESHRSKLFASYGTFNSQNYRLLADGPTGESSSYYFGLNHSRTDGFADNINSSGNEATAGSWNGRLGIDFTTADGVEVGIGGTWEEFKLGAQPLVPRSSSGNNKRTGFYDRDSSEDETAKINSNSQLLKISLPTAVFNTTSVTTRNDWRIDPSLVDLTFVDAQLANGDLAAFGFLSSTSKIIEEQKRIAEELTFSSEDESEWEWDFGINFANEEIDGQAERTFPNPGGWQENQLTSFKNDTDLFSAFGSFNHSISEHSSLEFGLRYDSIEREFSRNKTVTSSAGHNWSDPSNDSYDEDFFSPNITLTHDLKENISLFAMASQSFKPGGFSPYVDTNSTVFMGISNAQFQKEKNLSYEVGMHLSSADKLWNLDFAVFWSDVENFQFEKPTGTTDYFVDNAEEVEIFGFEIEVSGKATDQLFVNIGYGLTDGEITRHIGTNFNTGTFTVDSHDFAGADIPYSPEQTLSASVDYFWSDNLTTNLGIKNIGKIHYLDQTATDTVNDSYTLLNASVSYLYNDWQLNVFGTNLTDEEYYSSLVSSLSGVPGVVGSPRIIGLSITKEF